MNPQHSTGDFSRAQMVLLKFRDARARATNLVSLLLAGLILVVTTAGAMAAPPGAQVIVEDNAGNVVAAYDASMMDRATIGVSTALSGEDSVTSTVPAAAGPVGSPMAYAPGGDLVAGGLCNPDDPADWCYTPAPPPDSICTQQAAFGNVDTETLPVHRWTDATSVLHTRLGAKFYDDIMQKISRNAVQQGAMSVGNVFWSGGVAMTEAASKFCVGDNVGRAIDMSMAPLVRSIFFNAWVGLFLLLSSGLAIVFRASRSGSFNMAAAGRLALVTGLIVAMLNGSTATTATSYGTMSPGWMFQKVNNVLAVSAGSLSAALLNFNGDGVPAPETETPSELYAAENNGHCYNYMERLRDHYDSKYALAGVRGMTAAPRALDAIWAESALKSYTTTQFGSGNNYGDAVFCHQLELNAGTPGAEHAFFTLLALHGEYPDPDSPAMEGIVGEADISGDRDIYEPRDNLMLDQAMVFWASCQNASGAGDEDSWDVAPGWETIDNPNGITAAGAVNGADCHAAYSSSNGNFDWAGSAFNWQDNEGIVDGTQPGDVRIEAGDIDGPGYNPRQFLQNYQGFTATDGLVGAGIHAIVGLLIMVLFGAISMVVMLAKLAIMPLLAMVFFVAMADMLTGRAGSRLVKFAKLLLGMSIVTWGSSFLLTFLAVLTKVISGLGRALDLNVVGAIVWAGLAPVLAVFLIKFVFDKVLKMPDPLSLAGAKTYLGGAGAIGGAVIDRTAAIPGAVSQASWNRLVGRTPAMAGAGGGGAVSRGSTRGSLGGHSAGRGRQDSMAPELPGATGAPAGVGPATARASEVAARDDGVGTAPPSRAEGFEVDVPKYNPVTTRDTAFGGVMARGRHRSPSVFTRGGQRVAQVGGAASMARQRLIDQNPDWANTVGGGSSPTRIGRDGGGLPAAVAGSWGRYGDGRAVERARMIREGKAIERAAIGGHSETGPAGWAGKLRNQGAVRRAERQMGRRALQARRGDMGPVRRTIDRAGEAGRNLTTGQVAGGAAGVAVAASLTAAGSFAAVTLAPAAAIGAAGVGTVVAARRLRDYRSGGAEARKAARNERSLRTFLAQREAQVEREDDAEQGLPSDAGQGDPGAAKRTDGLSAGESDGVTRDDRRPDDGGDEGPVGGGGSGTTGDPATDSGSGRGTAPAPDARTEGLDPAGDGTSPAPPPRDAQESPATETSGEAPSGFVPVSPERADGGQPDAPASTGNNGTGGAAAYAPPTTPGPGRDNQMGRSMTTARRDTFDHDGRPEDVVKAERDVFNGQGVDAGAMTARRDVFDHDGRQEHIVQAGRDVFDHDGRQEHIVQARRDVFDQDGRPEAVSDEHHDGFHEGQAQRADDRAAGKD